MVPALRVRIPPPKQAAAALARGNGAAAAVAATTRELTPAPVKPTQRRRHERRDSVLTKVTRRRAVQSARRLLFNCRESAVANAKPTTHQGDLAKLPRALAPLIERPQWACGAGHRQKDGSWQKPPFMALRPAAPCQHEGSQHLARLRHRTGGGAGRQGRRHLLRADRVDDPFAAIDLDHCRHPHTHSLDIWAQNFSRHRPQHLRRGDAIRRRLPDLGPDRRGDQSDQSQVHTGDRRQASCRGTVPAHAESADRHRLSARHRPGAGEYRQGIQLGRGVGRAPQGRGDRSGGGSARTQRPRASMPRRPRARLRHRHDRADRA